MGKIKLLLKTKNKELFADLEYLLLSTGYFDLVKKDGEDVHIVFVDLENLLKKSFPEFLAEVLKNVKAEGQKEKAFSECGVKTIAIAALSSPGWTNLLAMSLCKSLFREGIPSAYISLSPFNTRITEVINNEKGFGRLLIDRRRKSFAPIEKYSYFNGETVYIGSPLYNPNAGDIEIDDIEFLMKVLSRKEEVVLIIDIGAGLDLEREKIFLAADYPVIGFSSEKNDEVIFHKYFEGAMPLLANAKNINRDVSTLLELVVKKEE